MLERLPLASSNCQEKGQMKISLISSSLRYPSQFGILIAGRRAQFVLFVDYVPTELDEYVVDKEPHYTHDPETVFIKRIEFLLTTYLLCLVDVYFSRQSTFLWIPTPLSYMLLHTGTSIAASLVRYIHVLLYM